MVAQVEIEDNLLELDGSEVSTIVDTIDGEDPFPKDAFSAEQRRSGALILHIIGILYVTRGMALVTINFFVPSLEVIMKKVSFVAMITIITLIPKIFHIYCIHYNVYRLLINTSN